MENIQWITVWETESDMEAQVLKSYLETNGIRVFIQGDEGGTLYPVRVLVQVPAGDEARARELVEIFFKQED